MKKYFSDIRTLAVLLMAGTAFAACSNSDDTIEQPVIPGGQVYTLTINATKGDATTRALAFEETKLVANWEDGDELTVYNVTKAEALTGVLTASNASGATATFSGTLTGTIEDGDKLTLSYHKPTGFSAYEAQKGTLASASERDYATATVNVDAVNGGNITIKETEGASFDTQTAVLKLKLTTNGTTTINPTSLKLSASMGAYGSQDIATFDLSDNPYSTNGNGILYFALPNKSDVASYLATKLGNAALASALETALSTATLIFTASSGTDGTTTYVAEKTGYTFAAGKYYQSTLTMTHIVNLTNLTADYAAKNGDVLTGSTSDYKVTIAKGATVTLSGVTISNIRYCIKCLGTATIILADGTTNNLTGTGYDYPALMAGNSGTTLTIQGSTGKLNVESAIYTYCAGIGGGRYNLNDSENSVPCGDIVIEGGVITAQGGWNSPGIGSDYGGQCGDITIKGGTVNATGGDNGAGIGSGFKGICGKITISGGTVNATGGVNAAGIGSGYRGDEYSSCSDITITADVISVKATKGTKTAEGEGVIQSIGNGIGGTCGTVTILSSNVTQN